MEAGAIELDGLDGGCALTATLESGQSYLWTRSDGLMYQAPPTEQTWYELAHEAGFLRVRRRAGRLEWEGTGDPKRVLMDRLRLDDDLPSIYAEFPDDPMLQAAINYVPGMRLVRDPPFACLISFICSAQMRVERIYGMQRALTETYGTIVPGTDAKAFPTPEALAQTTEADLRALGLGYRAPYVRETAAMVADGTDPTTAADMPYEDARSYLTQFTGVGEKVADCVLLFSLDHLEAVPLDTWIRKSIERVYPACARDSYPATSKAIRTQFGGTYAGYAQTYLFHYLRTSEDPW